MSDELARQDARERICGDAGERVGAAALQADAEFGHGDGLTLKRVHLGNPLGKDSGGALDGALVRIADGNEITEEAVRRVLVLVEVFTEPGVRNNFGAVIDAQNGSDVRVYHEAGKRAESEVEVVRCLCAAALGVIEGNDAINVWKVRADIAEAAGKLSGERAGAGTGAEDHNVISRADASLGIAAEAGESWWRVRGSHLNTGAKVRAIESEGEPVIEDVRGSWEFEVDVAFAKDAQDLFVADVFAGFDVAEGETESEAPGKERIAFANAENGETMAFEDGVREDEDQLADEEARAGRQGSDGDGDVIAGRGDVSGVGEIERFSRAVRHAC
jgi:hypothetical protein